MRNLWSHFSPLCCGLKAGSRVLLLFLCWALSGCALPPSSASSPPLPVSPPTPRLALAYAYYQNGQYLVALEENRKVLNTQTDEPQALALQGLIYARLDEPTLAQRSFLRAQQAAPRDADIAHNHGLFLCEQGQFAAAFERFGHAVQQVLYADKAKTFWVWGVCAQKSGDEAAAQSLWGQSLLLKSSAEPALALARSYRQQHMPQRAGDVLAQFNGTLAATAETLWQGIQWARQQGDFDTVKRYAMQLKARFPVSSQWDAFAREAYDD